MKKLMIAAAIVCAAVVSQASNFKWGAANICDGTDSTTAKYTGTAYLFDANVLGQKALYDAIAADESYDIAGAAVTSFAVNAGQISNTAAGNQFAYGTGGNKYDFYFAILDDGALYLSNVKLNQTANTTDTPTVIAFGSQATAGSSTYSNLKPASEFKGAGYWQTVPEPTSGLLLLLGVAGLALKRRRA